jgi:protein N-terminal methyltransferase
MNTRDCKGSNQFLDSLMKIRPELNLIKACDCGAGIGRVTKNFLLKRFENVDMVDSSHRLLENAPAYIGADATRVNFIQIGLQDYVPEKVYDVIWIQWVVGHLMDEDYINFFKRCLQGIREGGVIILKDNCAESSTFQVDRVDSSVSRHVEYHKILFDLAGLQVLKVSRQKDFPEELCPVVMFALIAK